MLQLLQDTRRADLLARPTKCAPMLQVVSHEWPTTRSQLRDDPVEERGKRGGGFASTAIGAVSTQRHQRHQTAGEGFFQRLAGEVVLLWSVQCHYPAGMVDAPRVVATTGCSHGT